MSTGRAAAAGSSSWPARRGRAARVALAPSRVRRALGAERGAPPTAVAPTGDATRRCRAGGTDLVVTSPGLAAGPAAAGRRGRGRRPGVGRRGAGLAAASHRTAPWLGVTGTNGKTTTVRMLAVDPARRPATARSPAGNVGLPVLDAVLADEPYDVLAVELSSFQLHWMQTVRVRAAAVLNVAPDHLDWHGSMEAYAAAKATVWRGGGACRRQRGRPARDRSSPWPTGACRPRRLHAGRPVAGRLGVRGGVPGRRAGAAHQSVSSAQPGWVNAGSTRTGRCSPRSRTCSRRRRTTSSNALAAAALARALGVDARRSARRAARPSARARTGSRTSRRSAASTTSTTRRRRTRTRRLRRCRPSSDVVWVAGGLAKGARFDELVAGAADRLRAAVLIGRDRALIAEALARHAPEVPVVEVTRTDTGAMDDVVHAAAGLAAPATPCCSRRPARPWTCSATTPRVATRSPTRCTGCAS